MPTPSKFRWVVNVNVLNNGNHQTLRGGGVSVIPASGAANVLVVNKSMPEQLAYDITRLLFEKKRELAAIHPEAAHLDVKRAAAGTAAAYHEGALRYYREAAAKESGR